MITKLDNPSIEKLNKILDIWLNVNIEAHHFVDEQYWRDNYEDVKKSLPDAELYVAIENDEIVAFSEIGPFIDMPLRNYSSGMVARLAFSVATVVVPEVLIVDEVLAVGDAEFQEKSRKRMMELMGGGTTVLFVSHNMEQIRQMCNRVVWLERGAVRMFDTTQLACDAYENG